MKSAAAPSEFCLTQDDICSHKHKAGKTPDQHEPDPESVPERGQMFVDCATAKDQLSVLPTAVGQESWDDVLDPIASIGPSDAHQRLQIMGADSH